MLLNHTKSDLVSEENDYVKFFEILKYYRNIWLIWKDFQPSTDNDSFGTNTKIYEDNTVLSCGYKLKRIVNIVL